LENIKEVVAEFEKNLNVEVIRQENLDMAEKKNSRRKELLENYMTKILYE